MPVENIAGEMILEWLELTGYRQSSLADQYQTNPVTFNQLLHGKRNASRKGSTYNNLLTQIISEQGITREKLSRLRKMKEEDYGSRTT